MIDRDAPGSAAWASELARPWHFAGVQVAPGWPKRSARVQLLQECVLYNTSSEKSKPHMGLFVKFFSADSTWGVSLLPRRRGLPTDVGEFPLVLGENNGLFPTGLQHLALRTISLPVAIG
ncbi:hypothetical protein LCGC14_1289660 [marine sediment metagenome]|uniref:Uncharacterized protein n=1 Tax=marine sediment metagenome TaxID=412755 RepID=A0A0F9KUI0_9ZZZZ